MADSRSIFGPTRTGNLNTSILSRLFLADHLLRDRVGHHLGYNLALAEAARNRGISVEILAAREWSCGPAGEMRIRPTFRRDYRANPPAWIASRFRLLQALEMWCDVQFAADLKRLPTMTSDDTIFAQMIAPRHFVRWLAWLAQCPSPPVLFLQLGYRPERFLNPVLRERLAELSPKRRARVVFVTDSEKLTQPFGEALGVTVHYLPHVLSYPLEASRPPAGDPVVYLPGNARREKGFAEVVEAVRQILASGNPRRLRFVLQCNHPDAASAAVLRGRPPSGPALEWIEETLSESEYLHRLASADVVLLPYHTDLYAGRTSGIFCECRVSGKPMIASRGTWAGDRIVREGGGWLVSERRVNDLVATLQRLPDEIVAVSSEARNVAPTARREFDREAFLNRLLELDGKARRDEP